MATSAIQLDDAFRHGQAAIAATLKALTSSHGDVFAFAFVEEYRTAILKASRTRICGLSEAAVIDATHRLLGARETV